MFNFFKPKKQSEFVLEDDTEIETENFLTILRVQLSRLIVYAESADVTLQRDVAENLANEAVHTDRQEKIVAYGGLKLLIPLTQSSDIEVRRLAAHALANLSVLPENQVMIARDGGIQCLIKVATTENDHVQRQSAKALANLAVNPANKVTIESLGGLPILITLSKSSSVGVKIEAIAALANLAVNDNNELEIVRLGGLDPICDSLSLAYDKLHSTQQYEDLAIQCCRALRNLTVNSMNKDEIRSKNITKLISYFAQHSNPRINQQASRVLRNITPRHK